MYFLCILFVPFRINKLVTRRSASRGDFELKNLGGVRFGGRVSGLRLPVPVDVAVSHARSDPCGCNLSKFSADDGRFCRCFGYQPRAGPPASRSISLLANT